MVTMIYFCGHRITKELAEFGPLHESVRVRPDGTCNRLRWCPTCTKLRMPTDTKEEEKLKHLNDVAIVNQHGRGR